MKLKPYRESIEQAVNVSLDSFLSYPLDKQIAVIRMLGAAEQMELVVSDSAAWSSVLSNWKQKALELFHYVFNQYTKGTLNSSVSSISRDYQLVSQFSYSLLCCSLTGVQLGKIRRLALDLLFLSSKADEIADSYAVASLLTDETSDTPDDIDFEQLDEYPHMARIFDSWEEQGAQISTTALVSRLSVLETFAYVSDKDYYAPYIQLLRDKLADVVATLSAQQVTDATVQDYASLFEFSSSLFENQELWDLQDTLYNKLDAYLQSAQALNNDSNLIPSSLVVEYVVRDRIRTGACVDE